MEALVLAIGLGIVVTLFVIATAGTALTGRRLNSDRTFGRRQISGQTCTCGASDRQPEKRDRNGDGPSEQRTGKDT